MNSYGYNLNEYIDDVGGCANLLTLELNKGRLALFLGAGVSNALDLPNWQNLVVGIYNDLMSDKLDPKIKYDGIALKSYTDTIKSKINNQEIYIETVRTKLYDGVDLNFKLAKKELLIALSSLMIGKNRGTVQNVITYNFDSVLEWYLTILGLRVNTISIQQLFMGNADVNITHIHGYLPHDIKYGISSPSIVFSNEEFVLRSMSMFDYWKDYTFEFFRRHVFLTIGLSADSVYNDICLKYLLALNEWYDKQPVIRAIPYGFAFFDYKLDDVMHANLTRYGIIPCTIDREEMPDVIFNIVQAALYR